MKKPHALVNQAGLVLIILLIIFSIYGAFLGSDNAQRFFNSRALSIYWLLLIFMLLAGFFVSRKLVKIPGLLLIHLGFTLVLVGGIFSSGAGYRIGKDFFGIDKIHRGKMLIYQGHESNEVLVEPGDKIAELPFSLKLEEFGIEYYEPKYLRVQSMEEEMWEIPVVLNTAFDLGGDVGKITILREFKNFKITLGEQGRKIVDSNEPGFNPAIEVGIEHPDGATDIRYVFERFASHVRPEDDLKLTYGGTVRDYISRLAIIRDGETVAQKDVEVNHPLHFGGYYFYQHSYDSVANQYSVIMVVSDSGLRVVYAGYILLIVGVFWHFWGKLFFRRTGK